MSNKSLNIIPEKNYFVQVMHNMDCVASQYFQTKFEAEKSGRRIAKMLKDNEPDECTYVMIWAGKQMINYIEY
jgi:hypothetical protein